jgi:sugar (pentulose or hexulose) kinase
MELFERIIAKVVGQEISVEEQQEVAGGMIDACRATGGHYSYIEPGYTACDYE